MIQKPYELDLDACGKGTAGGLESYYIKGSPFPFGNPAFKFNEYGFPVINHESEAFRGIMKLSKNSWNITNAVFIDPTTQVEITNKYHKLFTQKDFDYKGCLSLKKLFVLFGDIMEYDFATNVIGSFEWWERLKKAPWISANIYKPARRELEIKIRAQAVGNIRRIASNSVSISTAFNANKFLADRGWGESKETKRGRPSNEEIEGALKNITEEKAQLDLEAERILGKVN